MDEAITTSGDEWYNIKAAFYNSLWMGLLYTLRTWRHTSHMVLKNASKQFCTSSNELRMETSRYDDI